MPPAEITVIRANPNTDRAIRILTGPEAKAFFGIGGPFQYALQIGHAVWLS